MSLQLTLSEKEILNLPNDMNLGKYVREKYHNIKEDLERSMDVEYDHCVICGKQSPYTRVTHIDERIGYVEGGGQGCFNPKKCDKL